MKSPLTRIALNSPMDRLLKLSNSATASRRRTLAILALMATAVLLASPGARAADTSVLVLSGSNDLSAAGSYSPSGVPNGTNDVVFNYPGTFTFGTTPVTETFGSLNAITSGAVAISNSAGTGASTLTLGGGASLNSVAPSSSDLIYVATGGSLTITAGSGNSLLNVALGQSGNLHIAGTATASIGSVISGGFDLTKTGRGTLTVSGANTYTGATTIESGSLIVGAAAPSGAARRAG